MAIFTVHAPTRGSSTDGGATERFVFVRDGFYLWAFLLGPIWIVARRLWRVLLGYVSVQLVLYSALTMIGKPSVLPIAYLGLALVLALEAGNLRRWTLHHSGMREVGLVSADTREAAEQRFFDTWSHMRRGGTSSSGLSSAPGTVTTFQPAIAGGPVADIIGLFPHPGAPR